MNATNFFRWIGSLPPVLQAVAVVIAFAVVVAIILLLVDIAPRRGKLYTFVRLAMCLLIPLVVMFFFNSYYWAMGVAVAVGALFFWLDYRSRDGAGYLIQLVAFMAPALLLLLVGLVLPSIQTMFSSFMNSSGNEFVGLNNYLWIFTQSDGITAVINTIVWVLLVPTVSTIVGLAYAVFIDRTRGEKIYKVLVFMPMAISFVGASIIWRFIYEYRGPQYEQIGLLNQILVWLGGTPQQWLLNEPWNNLFLIVVLIWVQTGFAMVVLSASIKGVPAELLEAAELDGANAWQRFVSVTVPAIRPALIVVLTTISIASLKVFDIVRTMTAGNYGTSTLANEMYTQFSKFEAGRSAALSVILFILVLPIVIYNARQIKKQREIR
ncbi:MAG: sugar ABC transporter permease [Rhodoglobus sp.]|uniref:Sugar ABC transporter permease n=1 Tax=Microbacterium aurugineum TaxID=2851642 RepID=A0ABY4IW55_9MICO|nr:MULTISPECIES: sugar ABC transporter permease [Microbacterium]MDZ4045619.1 sugar ABC transporter permease [Rhodoglobus sp.]MCK8468400.1 sugar ABC transporter permease [Microbacterium aurugineum]MCK8478624.1 sugar ABC transporter permease [Microbacterium aurugineum]QEA27133.1 sugar ABC transporter permease [Microbacterium sp. CBA3102]TCJ28645.1 sugar ABC transporter permease [Microbacterium sp. PI-1]